MGMEIVERKRALLMTAEQEKEFERLSIRIQHHDADRQRYIGQLLVLLGILEPFEVRGW